MNILTKKQCITILTENNLTQPKAKYSNNILLAMLEAVSNKTIFYVEPTKSGFPINRGSLCECIIKALIYNTDTVFKSSQRKGDLNTYKIAKAELDCYELDKKVYEIKFATSFANSSKVSNTRCNKVILVTAEGIYLVDNKEKGERFKPCDIWNGEKLTALSEILGL